ncbi:TonB-dependent receptor [Sphingopyxis macrogoltabida]|uniref:TonB-dependent receptor n=1 Tax=Sphingopyxis macrogoltabida TaxID=33050 RepID=UPI0006ECF34C|nr:TonB-dependent receptor [Sphingopyxis macrogoltabida]ALJ13700.1 TonB-dependent receptor [Sphingopyxis macrogoltabida]
MTRFGRALLLTTCLAVPVAGAWAQDTAGDDDTIVVSGRRAADRAALETKRNTDTQVDEVRADDVGRLPDQNVAETLRRLPGLSVANDQGEGRYLTVRGVSPDLLNVTLNGQTAAAPEPDSRQVKLDDIPSALIGAITVSKTLTPDMDANAIAGAANIETVSAFDRPGTFGSLRGAYGKYDLNGKHPYELDASIGTRFGPDRQFGVVLAVNYSNREFEAENVQSGGSWEEVNGQFIPLEQTIRDYHTRRQRYGAVANFDWRPTDAVKTYARFLYSKYKDKESRPGFTIELDEDEITNQTAAGGDFAEADVARALRSRQEDSDTLTGSLGGEFDLGPSWLRIEGSYTRANKRDPHRDEISFEGEGVSGSYDLSDGIPIFRPDASAFDPSIYEFDETSYENRRAREDLYQFRADFRTPIAIGDDSSIKVGAKYTSRRKTNNIEASVYDGYDGDFTLDQVEGGSIGSIFKGRYPFGVIISRPSADDFFDSNFDDFELDEEGTVGDSLAGDYLIREKIFAAYAMATLKIGQITAIPGVRMEKTKSNYAAKAVLDSSTVDDLDKDYDSFGSQSYTDWFPGLNLRWDATQSLVFRAAVTRAIGRPNYEQLAPTTIVNTGDNEVEQGNPGLRPLTSTNYDLAGEFYIGRKGIISVAGFYKTIENPIYSATTVQSGTFAGQDLIDAQVTMPVNADSAFVKGVEINAQTELSFLPSPLDGFSLGGSITFVKSRAKGIPGRGDERLPLASQSNRVASAFLSYEKGGLSARIAYTYRSAYLLEPGEDRDTDLYVGAFNQWDARIGYDIVKHVTIFLEGSNLNDEPYRVFQGIPSRIDEVERYGYSVKTGVQFKF